MGLWGSRVAASLDIDQLGQDGATIAASPYGLIQAGEDAVHKRAATSAPGVPAACVEWVAISYVGQYRATFFRFCAENG